MTEAGSEDRTRMPLLRVSGTSVAGRRIGSFTLVELLVALAILSIIIILLINMLGSLLMSWQLGQAHNERRATARMVLERMSRDLRQAALPSGRYYNNNGSSTTVTANYPADTTDLRLIINPPSVSTNYDFPQSIFFQAPVGTDGASSTSAGNLAEVGYFVQWVSGAPVLSRILVNSSSSSYSIYSSANSTPTGWISDAIIQANAPATSASNYSGLMAANVLGLWFQALDELGNPIQQQQSGTNTWAGEAFDSCSPYSYTNYNYTNSAGALVAATNAAPDLPARIQIAILIVDSRTAVHLTGTEKPLAVTGNFWGDIQTFYNSLAPDIRKGAEIQSVTVEMANGPR